MSSTTSDEQLAETISNGDEFYVPFWIILPFTDTSPPDPFVKVSVLEKKWNHGTSPEGPVEILCCDLQCPKHIVASDIPASYLIPPADLKEWATNIADWFREYPERTNDV
jgi:hypothetical protein